MFCLICVTKIRNEWMKKIFYRVTLLTALNLIIYGCCFFRQKCVFNMFMLFHYGYLLHSTDDRWHKDDKYLVDIQYCILLEYHWAFPAETNVRARDLARGLLCAVCESVRALQEKGNGLGITILKNPSTNNQPLFPS